MSGEHISDGDVCRHRAGKSSKMDFTAMNPPGVTVKALAGKACQSLALIFLGVKCILCIERKTAEQRGGSMRKTRLTLLGGKRKANTVLEVKTRKYFVLTQPDLPGDTGWRKTTPSISEYVKPGTDNESEEGDALMNYSVHAVSCDNSLTWCIANCILE